MVQNVERQLQSKESDYCGLYVLFFLLMRLCKRLSLHDVYAHFIDNHVLNDYFVYHYMSQYFQ